MCFNLFYVNTRATLERAQVYFNITALIGLSAARINTKIIVARGIALSALKHRNK